MTAESILNGIVIGVAIIGLLFMLVVTLGERNSTAKGTTEWRFATLRYDVYIAALLILVVLTRW